jgi:hypothetical protein
MLPRRVGARGAPDACGRCVSRSGAWTRDLHASCLDGSRPTGCRGAYARLRQRGSASGAKRVVVGGNREAATLRVATLRSSLPERGCYEGRELRYVRLLQRAGWRCRDSRPTRSPAATHASPGHPRAGSSPARTNRSCHRSPAGTTGAGAYWPASGRCAGRIDGGIAGGMQRSSGGRCA